MVLQGAGDVETVALQEEGTERISRMECSQRVEQQWLINDRGSAPEQQHQLRFNENPHQHYVLIKLR